MNHGRSEAVSHNRSDIVEYLIQSGADVNIINIDGISVIRKAIIGCFTNIVHMFVKGGANVTCLDVKVAALRDHSEIFKLLIQNYVVYNNQNDSCLYEVLINAAQYNNLYFVKIVLDYKSHVNSRTCKGDTPLLASSTIGSTDITKLLIENGANVNDMDQFGKTPLMMASENDHPGVIELLLNSGTDVNAQDINGYTAFIIARIYGNTAVAEILLKYCPRASLVNQNWKETFVIDSYHQYYYIVRII